MLYCSGMLVAITIGGDWMDILSIIPEIRVWIQTITPIILVIIAIWSYKKQRDEKRSH